MKKVFLVMVMVMVFVSSAFAVDDQFTDKQKIQIAESMTVLAQDMNRIRERLDSMRKWFYAGFQSGGDNAMIEIVSSYVDASYTTDGECTTAGGTWTDDACYIDYDQTSCEGDNLFWTGTVCQALPALNGTNFQAMSAGDLSNMIGSMDNFLDVWWATHGTNFLKLMKSAQ